ncbi:hypothetical protein Mgra_00003489 [Meloidogyne graminicola]|uniref:EF-hand domain-containing protein n=1 Tax=Meloidogyne graminicola TaxID=189291 RepID=A0A8S9ZV15_9BILA|nr:hypothetical protein Mgra_00003489 [Meloidogyne graminicola]
MVFKYFLNLYKMFKLFILIFIISLYFIEGRVIWPTRGMKIPNFPSFFDGQMSSNPFELFQVIDEDNDGQLTFNEASNWFTKLQGNSQGEMLKNSECFLMRQMKTKMDLFNLMKWIKY